jgi:hypothetical protein
MYVSLQIRRYMQVRACRSGDTRTSLTDHNRDSVGTSSFDRRMLKRLPALAPLVVQPNPKYPCRYIINPAKNPLIGILCNKYIMDRNLYDVLGVDKDATPDQSSLPISLSDSSLTSFPLRSSKGLQGKGSSNTSRQASARSICCREGCIGRPIPPCT